MTSQKKPSRDEIDSKFVDVQNRIIGTLDNTDREQVIKEHLYPLVESIHNSNYFGDINPRDLTQRMGDHVDQLGSTTSPNVLPLYYFEQQLRSQIHPGKGTGEPRNPGHGGKGT